MTARDLAEDAGAAEAEAPAEAEAATGAPFYGPAFDALQSQDPEIAAVLMEELTRERDGLQLIASENVASPAVLAALGSTLTNKYAEGYPGRRYYSGCEAVDKAESIAIDRATALFGADHANMQPHSGASANLAAYAALLRPGDTMLAMDLAHGGHLTHGSRVNFSGRWFDVVSYGVRRDTELIDLDEVRDLAVKHQPKVIIAGATSYPRLIDFHAFRCIADEIGAWLLVDAAHTIGLIAGRAVPSPVPHADVVTFTTHKTLRGPRGGGILCTSELARKIDRAVYPFAQGGPLMNVVAAKAVALGEALDPAFGTYARRVIDNCERLTEALAGHGMRPLSGGTDTHLAVLDLRELGVTGAEAELRCADAGIMLSRNAIPYDPRPPGTASGIRLGTAWGTTIGLTDMSSVADLVAQAVREPGKAARTRGRVAAMMHEHPAYPGH